MKRLRMWAWVILAGLVVAPPAVAVCAVNATEIVGMAVWTPEAEVDDYRSLTYFPETSEWGLARHDFQGGTWHRNALSNAGSVMPREFTSNGSMSAPWIAPRAGMLTALTVCTETNIGAGATYTVALYKNGSSTGITATVAASTYKARTTLYPSQFVSFAAGDELYCVDAKTGSPTNTQATAQWWAVFTE